MDGDTRELKEGAVEFESVGRPVRLQTESLARGDVNRGLARDNVVVSGTTRGFFDDSSFNGHVSSTPAPATPAPPVPAIQLPEPASPAGGNMLAGAPAVQTPPANLGTLWSEDNVGQRPAIEVGGTLFNRSQPSPTTPLDSVSDLGLAVGNETILGFNYLSVAKPPVVQPAITVEKAQSIIEARRNSPWSSTTLGTELLRSADEKQIADNLAANTEGYSESIRKREASGEKPLAEWERAGNALAPALPDSGHAGGAGGIGGFGSGRGGGRRSGLVGGGGVPESSKGLTYAGVGIAPGNQAGTDGRNITDLYAVTPKMDGLKDAPSAPPVDSFAYQIRLADGSQPTDSALGVQAESKSKVTEDRFGRADDFVVTPQVLDRLQQSISAAPSYAGNASAGNAANAPLGNIAPSTTPGSVRFNYSASGARALTPVPQPARPASGPAPAETPVVINESAYVTALVATNAVVNYFSEFPATAGDQTVHWDFQSGKDGALAANNSWFGVNQGVDSWGKAVQPSGEREKKMAGLNSDLNGRVNVQLPAVAAGGLQFISEAKPAASSPAPLEGPLGRFKAIADSPVTLGEVKLQVTNSITALAFNPYLGTNAVPSQAGKPATAAEPVLAKKFSSLAPTPQPEVLARDNAFSTFSLNVADVSFKLAAASLEKGALPDVAGIRSEEFINAFDYRDPVPLPGVPVGFAWERARYPFAHNRDVLRFSVKTAAQGREAGRPLNIVLLLDNSGSMERADRVSIIQASLRSLAAHERAGGREQDRFAHARGRHKSRRGARPRVSHRAAALRGHGDEPRGAAHGRRGESR
jgi:hypothetical protein